MGYYAPPSETMDDITSVSCPERMEKTNTIRLTKNTEIRSKTLLFLIGGAVTGLLIAILLWGVLHQYGAIFVVAGGALGPFMGVGTVKDATHELRWKRALRRLQSTRVDGKVFLPNSTHAENVTRMEKAVFVK
ncbi:hypothetical protein [Pseudoscardovia suis]|uniref:Uncharacterized protein n=1 Tax=Pseudoscardovia suis TaxID=987063 RepID=A0A261EPR0_9BIFI|nr:hypothetical protein [Pseudoscardovia suis]OZG48833.1 hypothetical protein PSSU_1657 [Pseudoscardovia suis]PJJ63977.1 hypothetical protein CLV65_1601 [Pseudoscardovia suis]